MEYPKIQTIFKRDNNHIIIPTKFSKPEFDWLKYCKFRAEEKIDGTNIRVEITFDEHYNPIIEFKGRTNRSIIPSHLMEKLQYIFSNRESIKNTFVVDKVPDSVTLYGEGYGYKIQTGGNNYIYNDVDFILFDCKVDNIWLNRKELEDIASKLHISIVPVIGNMTIYEACQYVNKGFNSVIAENPNYEAEGLVLKTPDNIFTQDGERIVLKIKAKDFKHFNDTYGYINYNVNNGNLVLSTNVQQVEEAQ